jgi:hypothetical protein
LANPYFVIDAPGGGGKIPLLPEYVESMNEDEVVLRNYRGERYVYKQPAPGQKRLSIGEPEYLFQPSMQPKKVRKRVAKVKVAAKRKSA